MTPQPNPPALSAEEMAELQALYELAKATLHHSRCSNYGFFCDRAYDLFPRLLATVSAAMERAERAETETETETDADNARLRGVLNAMPHQNFCEMTISPEVFRSVYPEESERECSCFLSAIQQVLAATPAQSMARVKAEALREAAMVMKPNEPSPLGPGFSAGWAQAAKWLSIEADRLQAASGEGEDGHK